MRYETYEIQPCREVNVDGQKSVEDCEPEKAEFWGVYGRDAKGLAWHIADCCDERAAKIMFSALNFVHDCNQEFLEARDEWESECYPDDEDEFECPGLDVTEAILKLVGREK